MSPKSNKHKNKAVVFISIIIFICCLTPNLYGEDNMEPIYKNVKTVFMPRLEPQVYPIKEDITGIMDFPVDNAIATNELPDTNAVTLIKFNEKKLKVKYKTVAKNFIKYVGGGEPRYLPIFSEKIIGYEQTRGFTLLDIKRKKGFSRTMGDLEYSFGRIRVVDPEKLIFLFDLYNGSVKINSDDYKLFHITQFDLKNKETRTLSLKRTGSAISHYFDDTVFLFRGNKVETYNTKFEPIDHPFATKFNQEKKRFTEVDIDVGFHPNLPFAVFTDAKTYITWIISWEDRKNPVLYKVFNFLAYHFRFSYDGKWLIFQNTEVNMIMPVNPDLPHYLGKPILLAGGKKADNYRRAAMTRNPSGLVVSGSLAYHKYALTKWDFTKAFELIKE